MAKTIITLKIKLTLQNKSIYHTLLFNQTTQPTQTTFITKNIGKVSRTFKMGIARRSQVMQYFYVNIDSEGYFLSFFDTQNVLV